VKANGENLQALFRQVLIELGEDPNREGLVRSPQRIAEALTFLTSGYGVDFEKLINGARFKQETTSMVILRDIEFYSLCEHHLLPFFGRCHIGYLPSGRIFGVSKLARLVDVFARRLQLQERLTEQISRAIMDAIQPVGVGVMIEAQHMCIMMRGIEKQQAIMTTSSLLGSFRDNPTTRQEFISLINRPSLIP
jgi:GTP cyclohydrolase I